MPKSLDQGRLRLSRILGRGANATVWRAQDRTADRSVAVKVLVRGASPEQFLAAGRLQAEQRHPGFVSARPPQQENGTCFQELELAVDTVSDRVRAGTIEPMACARRLLAVLSALQELHEQGVAHLDVTPRNLMIRRDETIALTDFGAARPIGQPTGGAGPWRPPEQTQGEAAAPTMDVYAVGAVLFTVATRARPYGLSDDPGALRALPAPLRPALERALHQDPAARWPTPAALREALAQALDPAT